MIAVINTPSISGRDGVGDTDGAGDHLHVCIVQVYFFGANDQTYDLVK